MLMAPHESKLPLTASQKGSAQESDVCSVSPIIIHIVFSWPGTESCLLHQTPEEIGGLCLGATLNKKKKNTHLNTCLTLSTTECSYYEQSTGTRMTDPAGDIHLPISHPLMSIWSSHSPVGGSPTPFKLFKSRI